MWVRGSTHPGVHAAWRPGGKRRNWVDFVWCVRFKRPAGSNVQKTALTASPSSGQAVNSVNTGQSLLSRMNGSMWRQPWMTSCRPHTLLMCSNIYVEWSGFTASDCCQISTVYTHHTDPVVLEGLRSPPHMDLGPFGLRS